ncbi:DUF4349 domain-containing protein [Nocardioides antri]|uniref:DUF4349 domain-containing protein n=1 Tax=Nocardioides antri TaxID=2607659 RepID=A0A5B1M579_9ACTN|nr:DUF4349 domain-containing protein [Nocardioides antri]KAA1426830.1 DUF4349 domain-containing protein [Nocardioides antri]
MRPAARRRPSRLLLALVAALLAASGCTSSGDEDGRPSGSFEGAGDESAEAPTDLDGPALREAEANDALDDSALNAQFESAAEPVESDRKLIAKGNVSLESDDVEAAVVDVQEITDRYFGEITERETTTNDEGELKTARLLLRIPVDDFTAALADLEQAADLQSSSSGSEDVTTKVIDTQVRIRAQRRSLRRVEFLLDRAQSISDIIRIEGQLTRRQADLDSLEQRLDYLQNQTSMSTITVNISLPPPEKKKEKKDEPEESGFLAGLSNGWDALKSFGTDVATLTGQVLPFAVVLLLIGGPLWLLVRRFLRRDDAPVTAPADA